MSLRIGFFIYRDFQLLDLAGPLAAFQVSGAALAPHPYRLQVLSRHGGPVPSNAGVVVESQAVGRVALDTLVVVGGWGVHALETDEIACIRRLAARARRIASVCTGAFALARCGLLDGRRATTHWAHAASLQQDYPAIRVEGERIHIADGPVWTSAGVTAGIDLALALIEADLGEAVARAAAQELVMYYRRPGGQSQFSALGALQGSSDRIRMALSHARSHLGETRCVEDLARAACLSPRQFGRLFRQETGETPARALERLRAEVARERIENSREPVERIAAATGFADPERMRRAFLRLYGHPPQALRRFARADP